MRLSRYMHTLTLQGNTDVYLFNLMTGKQLRLSSDEKALLDAKRFDDLERLDILLQDGFVTNEDELNLLRKRYLTEQHNTEVLKLTIAPTMACNFGCSYCFESAIPGRMAETTQQAVAEFTQRMLAHYGCRELLVAWYGGEPMLCMDIIVSLTEKLRAICRDAGCRYTARIVTNGWFFDQTNADILEQCDVKNAQITLDGGQLAHDCHRHLKNGEPTYARIVGNLEQIHTGIELDIRCNFHRNNLNQIPDLISLVRRLRKNTGNKVYLEPARVLMTSDHNRDHADLVQEAEDASYTDLLLSLGAPMYRPVGVVCASVRETGFGIDPLGNLSRCWEHIGDPNHRFSTVWDYSPAAFQEDPFPGDSSPCRECALLPICMGGCPTARRTQGVLRCLPIKNHLKQYLLAQVEK